MKLPLQPFAAIDWTALPAETHPGAQGTSTWRTAGAGGLRLRLVDYGAGYVADHWCDLGHVVFVVSGRMLINLRDGRELTLEAGAGFCVSDYGDAAHMVTTDIGCQAFIVD